MLELTRERPGLALRAGMASDMNGWRIEAREVDETGENLEGVLVYMPSLDETIFSKRGTILETERAEAEAALATTRAALTTAESEKLKQSRKKN